MTQRQTPVPTAVGDEDPIVPAAPLDPDAADPAEGINPGPGRRGFSRSRAGFFALVAGVATVILLFLFIARGSGPVDVASGLVDGLVARDATAALFLTDRAGLPVVARDFGFAPLPRSVTVALGKREFREVEGSTGGSSRVIGTWTLTTSGRDGQIGVVEQEATFDLSKGANGPWLVDGVTVSTPVHVDLAEYFGRTGTSKADRDAALEDLQAGVAWLGDTRVGATESTTDVIPDPVFIADPDALTTRQEKITEAVVGKVTHWSIVFDSGGDSQDIEVASAQTVHEEPARIMRGTLTPESVVSDAGTWARAWVGSVLAGDTDAMTKVTDPAAVSASAWERMKVAGELAFDEATPAGLRHDNPITVRYGGLELVRQNGGTWLVDPISSGLMRDWIAGTGKAITVKNYDDFANDAFNGDGTKCDRSKGAVARLTFEGIAFYGGGELSPPLATFRFDASGDLACSGGITIDALKVAWSGHSDAVLAPLVRVGQGSDGSPYEIAMERSREAATSLVHMPLPSDITPSQVPIHMHVTVDGLSQITHDLFGFEGPSLLLRVGGESDFTAARP